jgi:hypothetical protein
MHRVICMVEFRFLDFDFVSDSCFFVFVVYHLDFALVFRLVFLYTHTNIIPMPIPYHAMLIPVPIIIMLAGFRVSLLLALCQPLLEFHQSLVPVRDLVLLVF